MNTIKKLYARITALENLFNAFKKAAKGKRWKVYVDHFKLNFKHELFGLQDELLAKTYQSAEYDNFYITIPKRRRFGITGWRSINQFSKDNIYFTFRERN